MLPNWILTPELSRIWGALNDFDTRLVGGTVRAWAENTGIADDFDLATTATPNQVMKLLRQQRIMVIPTGKKYGTVTAIVNKISFEITTLRKDIATDGRRAVVTFTDSFEEDAKRRDFTFNAMYLSREGHLFDPHNGLNDLQQRRLRFIGNAQTRIQEDALRMLRYFRFSAKYNCEIDAQTAQILQNSTDLLQNLSKERITQEFFKILQQPHCVHILQLDNFHTLLKALDLHKCNSPLFSSYVEKYNLPKTALHSLFLLYFTANNFATAHFKLLILSHKQKTALKNWQKCVQNLSDTQKSFYEALYRHKKDDIRFILQIYACNSEYNTWAEKLLQDIDKKEIPVFPIRGKHLISAHIPEGKARKKALAYLETYWLKNQFPDTQALLKELESYRE